ncbi:MAG: SOS response-associated peptidase [Paracoccaceae bacterium]
MCGRMVLIHPLAEVARLFAAAPDNDLPEASHNVCPTQAVPVVTSQDGARRMRPMRWGLVPHWYDTPTGGPLLINARAETVATKPAFRDAARHRRGIVPATGFYEWTKDADGNRDPWYIHPPDGGVLALAAIWQDWRDLTTVAVVTTSAGGPMTDLHHRTPVLLAPADWAKWLGEDGHGAAALMRAPEDDALIWHRVDRAVNSNRAQGPQLIEPWDPPAAHAPLDPAADPG